MKTSSLFLFSIKNLLAKYFSFLPSKYIAEIGFLGDHFSNTIMSSSKWVVNSGDIIFKTPFWETTNILSSPLNSPNNSPLLSTFNFWTVSSNQIFLGLSVETPFSFNSILLIVFLVKILPLVPLPLISTSLKSISHFSFFNFEFCRKLIVTFSASPLGFAEKYFTTLGFLDDDKLYILSLVIPETANLFM